MRSKCDRQKNKRNILACCLSLPLLSVIAPYASADNNDGATLPSPTKKSATTSASSAANKKNQKPDADDMGPPPADGDAGGRRGPGWGPPHDSKGGPPPMRHNGGFVGMLDFTALGLTDDQKQKIQKLRSDSAIKNREIQRKVKESSNQMRDTMFDGTSTDAQIKAKSDDLKRAHEQFADSQLDFFLAIRQLLTPEQKAKLKDVRTAIEQRHADDIEHRGERRHGGPPPPPDGGIGTNPDKSDNKKKP